MLEVASVNAFYGSIQALCDVSFRVEKGEIITLLGSNGAGKSTAINVAQGLMRPSSRNEKNREPIPFRVVNSRWWPLDGASWPPFASDDG